MGDMWIYLVQGEVRGLRCGYGWIQGGIQRLARTCLPVIDTQSDV